MLPPATRAGARTLLAFLADTSIALTVGAALQRGASALTAQARRAPRATAALASLSFATLLLLATAPAHPPSLPPPAVSLPGPYILHAPPNDDITPPPLPSLGFAIAPRPHHSDDAALSHLAAPARAPAFWGGGGGGGADTTPADPPTFILEEDDTPPSNSSDGAGGVGAAEPAGARVVRAAVLARRQEAAAAAARDVRLPSAWLAAPPAVVWLPPGVARALAAAADAVPSSGTYLALLADARLGAPGGLILTDAALGRLDSAAGRAAWAACLASGGGRNASATAAAATAAAAAGDGDPAAACLEAAGLTLLDARFGVALGEVEAAPAWSPSAQPGGGGVAQLLADALLAAAGVCGVGARCRGSVDRTAGAVLTRVGAEEPPVPGASPVEAAAPPAPAPAAALAARLVVAALATPGEALGTAGGGGGLAADAAPPDAALVAAAARVREAVVEHCPPIDLLPPAEEAEEGEGDEGGGEERAAARAAAAEDVAAADALATRAAGVFANGGFAGRRAVGEAAAAAVGDLLRALVAATG